jgi:hypothetical protein
MLSGVAESFEVKLANGERETADSLWGARNIIARRCAFDADPTRPVNVLPAEIWRTGASPASPHA